MEEEVKFNQNGQLTIPAKFRHRLGAQKDTRAVVSLQEDGTLTVRIVDKKQQLPLREALKKFKPSLSYQEHCELIEAGRSEV